MSSNFIELLTLILLENQSINSPSVVTSLQKILNTLSSTPGALTFQIRKSSSSQQLLLLVVWIDKAGHDYLDDHGITPKLLKELHRRVKPEAVHHLNYDASLIDCEANPLTTDTHDVKEGKREDFTEEAKICSKIGA